LTLVLRTAQELDLGPAASDKVLADSISSMFSCSNRMLTFGSL
jgi:hypothetical protein